VPFTRGIRSGGSERTRNFTHYSDLTAAPRSGNDRSGVGPKRQRKVEISIDGIIPVDARPTQEEIDQGVLDLIAIARDRGNHRRAR
jgi:hypothetical protein